MHPHSPAVHLTSASFLLPDLPLISLTPALPFCQMRHCILRITSCGSKSFPSILSPPRVQAVQAQLSGLLPASGPRPYAEMAPDSNLQSKLELSLPHTGLPSLRPTIPASSSIPFPSLQVLPAFYSSSSSSVQWQAQVSAGWGRMKGDEATLWEEGYSSWKAPHLGVVPSPP